MKYIVVALALAMVSGCPDEDQCSYCSPKNPGTCEFCTDSYLNPTTRKCEAVSTISHCGLYSEGGNTPLCGACDYGYYTSADRKTCESCKISGCARCDISATQCQACFNGVMTNGTSCDSSLGKCADLNCDVCSTVCHKCKHGFSLTVGENPSCVAGPENCWYVNKADATKCVVCEFGYDVRSDGTCRTSPSRVSRWWLWLLLALLLLLLVLAAVWYFSNKRRDNDMQVEVYQPAPKTENLVRN